jgi:DNA-binding beta-propeller fold protein YncE
MRQETLIVALGDRRYAVERNWARLPAGQEFGFLSDVAVDSKGVVHVGQRTDTPMMAFGSGGELLRGWGGGEIADVHGVSATADGRVLVVDRDAHQVLIYDTQGRRQLALGERHSPRLQGPFNHPTSAAIAPDGDIYVSDGYGNSVVHRFGADGRLKCTWGGRGTGPGEFTTPHAVWIDPRNRVLVADRENNRVQIFDRDGAYLAEWGDFYHPMAIYGDDRGMIYVTDQIPRISMLSLDGELVGRCRGTLNGAHGMSGDSKGNFYLSELPPEKITRLTLLR